MQTKRILTSLALFPLLIPVAAIAGCGASAPAGNEDVATADSALMLSIADWGYSPQQWWVDFDGDGKADYCRHVGEGSGPNAYLNCSLSTGTGLTGEATVSAQISDWGYSPDEWMVDFNGDGKADLCRHLSNGNLGCSLSTGTGLSGEYTVNAPINGWGYGDRRWMVDFDGDGKADFCRAVGDGSGPNSYLLCTTSTGSGMGYDIWSQISDWGYSDRRWMVDFNGDGKVDYCRAVGDGSGPNSYLRCSLSAGGGGLAGDVWMQISDWGYSDRRFFADVDGDGKADFCRAVGDGSGPNSYLRCSLSTGSGLGADMWVPVADWGAAGLRWMADFNGDHKADFLRAEVTAGLVVSFSTGTTLSNVPLNLPYVPAGSPQTFVAPKAPGYDVARGPSDSNSPTDRDCQTGTYTVPPGVTLVEITATGGSGQSGYSGSVFSLIPHLPAAVVNALTPSAGNNGLGAIVDAYIPVTPGQTLYVTAASNAGFGGPGYGWGFPGAGTGYNPGGGASFVSTAAPTKNPSDPASCYVPPQNLLIVAGGGGGGGNTGNWAGTAGGNGGNAGLLGQAAGGGGAGQGSLSGGGGGGGTQLAGGGKGSHPGCGSEYRVFGGYLRGGDNGGLGGSGGAGYYGGGAGGGGDCVLNTGNGGGGGGSSWVIANALIPQSGLDGTASPGVVITPVTTKPH